MKLVLEIGGIPIGVEHDSPGWDVLLRRTFGGFLSGRRPVFTVFAEVVGGFNTGALGSGSVLHPRPDGAYDMLWHNLRGVMDPKSGECRVTVSDNVNAIGGVLRSVLARLVISRNGLLLHSASFARGKKAYLFPGVSTAGKSTLAMVTIGARGDCELLTDEVSLVRRIKGRWLAFGTPFWGEARISGRNTSAPVEKICFIEKARRHGLTPLPLHEAYARLVQNTFQAVPEKNGASAAMDTAGKILKDVPAYVLRFRKDAGFWELL